MADEYISPSETQIYGPFAREQMREVCVGLVPELDGAVEFAVKTQRRADNEMKAALDRQPQPGAHGGGAQDDPVGDAADAIVRFGKHLESHKGRPVSNEVFFGREAPSIVARRRLTKLVAAVKHIADKVEEHKDKIRESGLWLDEFRTLHGRLAAVERAARASKVEQADLRPDLAAAREGWLAVYNANKAVIAGVLRHAGKVHLLPLIFDDLAEVHRSSGVTDEKQPVAPANPSQPVNPTP